MDEQRRGVEWVCLFYTSEGLTRGTLGHAVDACGIIIWESIKPQASRPIGPRPGYILLSLARLVPAP
eukprot:8111497-Pyramimonas_sp.AAC.1